VTFTINKKHILIGTVLALGLLSGAFLWLSKDSPKNNVPKTSIEPLRSTTEVSAVPKASKDDNDVELTQTYKAKVNGVEMIVPVKTSSASSSGTKGILKQEIDLTGIVSLAKEAGRLEAKKEYQKTTSVSLGYGIHNGDDYIPVEVERVYSHSKGIDKAISLEVHVDVPEISSPSLKVTGGEVKHSWRF